MFRGSRQRSYEHGGSSGGLWIYEECFLEGGEVPRDEGVRGVEKRGCDDEMVQGGFGRKGQRGVECLVSSV